MKIPTAIACAILLGCGGKGSEGVRTLPKEIRISPGLVEISGRWVADQELDVPLLAKANAADVRCVKETGLCMEALAALVTQEDEPRLKGQLLLPHLNEFVIESWSEDAIRAKAEMPVADVYLEIDFRNEAVLRTHTETKARGNQTADSLLSVRWRLD